MRIQLIYYSGVRNTAYLSILFEQALIQAGHTVRRNSLEDLSPDWTLPKGDMLGFASPVYHTAPPEQAFKFLNRLSGDDEPLFTFWSKGLYAGDCARIFQQVAVEWGLRPAANFEATFPGVDFVMQLGQDSFINRRFNMRMTKDLPRKVGDFVAGLSPDLPLRIEPPRWYVPLNDIARDRAIPVYDEYKTQLHALPDRCTQGNWCVTNCPEEAIRPAAGGVEIDPVRCALCLRCFHFCPTQAIQIGENNNRGRYAGPHQARDFAPIDGYTPLPITCEEENSTQC